MSFRKQAVSFFSDFLDLNQHVSIGYFFFSCMHNNAATVYKMQNIGGGFSITKIEERGLKPRKIERFLHLKVQEGYNRHLVSFYTR